MASILDFNKGFETNYSKLGKTFLLIHLQCERCRQRGGNIGLSFGCCMILFVFRQWFGCLHTTTVSFPPHRYRTKLSTAVGTSLLCFTIITAAVKCYSSSEGNALTFMDYVSCKDNCCHLSDFGSNELREKKKKHTHNSSLLPSTFQSSFLPKKKQKITFVLHLC